MYRRTARWRLRQTGHPPSARPRSNALVACQAGFRLLFVPVPEVTSVPCKPVLRSLPVLRDGRKRLRDPKLRERVQRAPNRFCLLRFNPGRSAQTFQLGAITVRPSVKLTA